MKKRPVQKPETVKPKDRNETNETNETNEITEATKTKRSKRNHGSDWNETITVVSFNRLFRSIVSETSRNLLLKSRL